MYTHSIKLEARYPRAAETPEQEVHNSVLKVLSNWMTSHGVMDSTLELRWFHTTDDTDQVVILTVLLETENKLDILDYEEEN